MSRFAVFRPVTVIMLNLGLIVLGLISASRIQMRLLPPIVTPEFSILTSYPGATPLEVEEKVTALIEKAVSTENGLYRVESNSLDALSEVRLKFTSDIKVLDTITNIREKLDAISFEDGVGRPRILRFDPNSMPLIRMAIIPSPQSKMNNAELAQFLIEGVQRKIESLDGVALVSILGSPQQEINIYINYLKANSLEIDVTSLPNLIQNLNKDLPAGAIVDNGKRLSIRLEQKIKNLEALRKLTLKNTPQGTIILSDIARIELVEKSSNIRTHLDHNDSLILEVKKESEANAIKVAENIREILQEFFSKNPDIKGNMLIDQGKEIHKSINEVFHAVLEGGILSAIVIFVFLQSIGPTTIISLSIPMSLVITLILMYFSGMSFNLMSLGGLALGIGMLVDNSIVVLENINLTKLQMPDLKQAIIWGTEKVSGAIVSSTLSTIAVFAPLIFVEGMIGQLFRDISLAVVFSLSASLFSALILIPCLSSLQINLVPQQTSFFNLQTILLPFARNYQLAQTRALILYPYYLFRGILASWQCLFFFMLQGLYLTLKFLLSPLWRLLKWIYNITLGQALRRLSRFIDWLRIFYGEKLTHYLEHRRRPLVATAILFFISLISIYMRGGELFPPDSVNRLIYSAEFTGGISIDLSEKILRKIEKNLLTLSGVKHATSIVGQNGPDSAQITIEFTDNLSVEQKQKTEGAVVGLFEKEPDFKFSRTIESMISSSKPIAVEIYEDDLDKLSRYQKLVSDHLHTIKGLKEIEAPSKPALSEINVRFRQERLQDKRVSADAFTEPLNLLIMGRSAGNLVIDGKQIPIKVQAEKNAFNRLEKLKYFSITSNEQKLPLNGVSELFHRQIQGSIHHVDRKRVAEVLCDISPEIDLKTASAKIVQGLDKILTPKGIKWKMGGQDLERKRSEKGLMFAIFLSIFLIYLLLASQFESFLQPAIILMAVPLCLIGVSVVLNLFNLSVSALVLIGFVILAGVSVNTSIVLVDTINQRMRSGMQGFTHIVEAAKGRLRPILMTTSTTIVGLIPMALDTGHGASMQRPLAITIIGGVASSTFLTLFIVPIIYDIFTRKKNGGTTNSP